MIRPVDRLAMAAEALLEFDRSHTGHDDRDGTADCHRCWLQGRVASALADLHEYQTEVHRIITETPLDPLPDS